MQPAARCSLTSFELSPQPVQLNRGLKSRRKMASPAVLRAAGLGQWGLKSWARWPVSRIHARMAATVILEPAGRCRWDEPVRIAVRGLAPEQPVTLRASLRDEKGALFRAHARYCADAEGQVDLERAPALGGSFAGLEPMGLLWALEPEKPLLRLVKRDVQTPFAVELEVLDGHDEPECGRLLGRAVHERDFLGPGVRREPVRAGRVRATLFLPPEPGPFPGIVDISGAGGGLLEYRASLLAGKGFAVMALAYYNCEDLPKSVETLHLEYFEEAVNYLLSHPQVKGPGVGLLGISKGGDLCLSMASFLKGITAAVIINGSVANVGGALHYKGETLPPVGVNPERIKVRMTTTGRVNSMPLRPLNAYRPMVRRSPGSSVTRGRGTTLSLLTSPCAQLPCTPWWAVLSSGEGSPGLMPWPRWMPGNSSRLSSTNTWVVRSWGDSLENQLQ
ncbi:acyl-coenzyme A thioesterase 1-like isoform X2 [Diceros bicornis minor]|uniref:acyl-coenzyme A thioesterase 1-like isoform X2 n=1 Tax=Diceros bicornis minor TaxID=77932 RepID=UPI0026EE513F|nr:acyl-coenzyme A thioesterase 1-like isoform X2 [Diceros bicornis minor]